MTHLRRFISKLLGLFKNSRTESDLEREIASHLVLLEDDFVQQGMSPQKAYTAARRVYGGVERAKQLHRDERSIRWIDHTVQNLRYGFRQLRKSKAFTATVLLTLSLGIGANTAIFSVVYAVLLAPLPYPDPNELMSLSNGNGPVAAQTYLDWAGRSTAFQDLKAWTAGSAHSFNIATHGEPEYVSGMKVSPGYFRMLGSGFVLGRDFRSEEGYQGRDRVVILTHAVWKKLGANPAIIGTTMRMNGDAYMVVGVLAPGPQDQGPGQLIVPLAFKAEQLNYKFTWLFVTGRLKATVTLKQAQANMDAVAEQMGRTDPDLKNLKATVQPLSQQFITNDRKRTLWLLFGAVGFILLIACMNVANLLLARGMSRRKEMAVRGSLGATHGTIFAQLLTESLLLAGIGGMLGLAIGFAALKGFAALMPLSEKATAANMHLNVTVLLFTIAATTVAGLLFGCVPAWYSSRIDPAEVLKDGGRTGADPKHRALRQSLVVGEFAAALAILAGAGSAIHSFYNLVHANLGLRTDHIMTFHLQVPESRPKDSQRIVAYYRDILDKVGSVPGVSHAAAIVGMPLGEDNWTVKFAIAGSPDADVRHRPVANLQQVTPSYCQTFGIRLVRGRMISDEDNEANVKVLMVNEDFVSRFMKGVDPLKQRLVLNQIIPGVWSFGDPVVWQIVGVINTVRHPGDGHGFSGDNPEITLPFWQSPWPNANIAVRTKEEPASMLRTIDTAVHSVDSQIALGDQLTMDEFREGIFANDRFTVMLLSSFGVTALLIAAMGIYGVMAFSVAQRSHEIAVRMALGASRSRVVALIVKEGLAMTFGGFVGGLLGSIAVGRTMHALLYNVATLDVPTICSVALLLLLTAMGACYLPALRAASVRPMEALRME
ncbi:MAG TPA: ABC transporter permease [Edaphobacter sp.]|nr:ABC transporter permease [Edaphobacter sp.]